MSNSVISDYDIIISSLILNSNLRRRFFSNLGFIGL